MKKTIPIFLLLSLILLSSPVLADTGTYEIQDYKVLLEPHYNGTVDISYQQTWLVTSGHIPWITVGLPNSHYSFLEVGGDAAEINSANEGSWSGARIDLNKDYQPQETFTIYFKIRQNNLLDWKTDHYEIEFTPGWYDRAVTDNLQIKATYPSTVNVTAYSPEPTTITDSSILWTTSLNEGDRYTIWMQFPNGTYNPALITSSSSSSSSIESFFITSFVILILGALLLSFVGTMLSSTSGSGYSSTYGGSDSIRKRRSSYDNDGHPIYVPPAVRTGSSHSSIHSSHSSSSESGAFSGRSSSCACACVACACACACAGGGGAGCTKKGIHTCPSCSGIEVEDEENKNN